MYRILSPILALCFLSGCLWGDPALAASDPETNLTTLYGMFRQSPGGGIVFTSPQEPDVVYLPFDPGAIMGDVLNIEVRLRGTIRDTFTRQGKSYRVVAVVDVKPMTAEYGATTITDKASFGLPGTDAVQIHAYHDRACYLYARYAVLEKISTTSDGHSLRVLSRTAADAPDAVCENLEGTPLFEIPNGGDFAFAGLTGDTLFVQNGQPEKLHGLMSVNLTTRQQTLNATVTPGAALRKGVLHYRQLVPAGTTKKACPAGGNVTRAMLFDLKSGISRQAGKIACWP